MVFLCAALTEPLAHGSAISSAMSLEVANLNSKTVGLSGLRSQLHETRARVMRRTPISSLGGRVSYSTGVLHERGCSAHEPWRSKEFTGEAIHCSQVYTGVSGAYLDPPRNN